MNNDLIKRDYIVEVYNRVKEVCKNCDNYNGVRCRACDIGDELLDLQDIIDNAPTVENITIFCENADEKTIKELKAELERVINELRPQSEWGKWVITEIQCPNCFEYFETDCYSTGELNKCPNCGADMRGEGNT